MKPFMTKVCRHSIQSNYTQLGGDLLLTKFLKRRDYENGLDYRLAFVCVQIYTIGRSCKTRGGNKVQYFEAVPSRRVRLAL